MEYLCLAKIRNMLLLLMPDSRFIWLELIIRITIHCYKHVDFVVFMTHTLFRRSDFRVVKLPVSLNFLQIR